MIGSTHSVILRLNTVVFYYQQQQHHHHHPQPQQQQLVALNGRGGIAGTIKTCILFAHLTFCGHSYTKWFSMSNPVILSAPSRNTVSTTMATRLPPSLPPSADGAAAAAAAAAAADDDTESTGTSTTLRCTMMGSRPTDTRSSSVHGAMWRKASPLSSCATSRRESR